MFTCFPPLSKNREHFDNNVKKMILMHFLPFGNLITKNRKTFDGNNGNKRIKMPKYEKECFIEIFHSFEFKKEEEFNQLFLSRFLPHFSPII